MIRQLLASLALLLSPALAAADCYGAPERFQVCTDGTVFEGLPDLSENANAHLFVEGDFVANIVVIDTPEAAGLSLAELEIFALRLVGETGGVDPDTFLAGRELVGEDVYGGVTYRSSAGPNSLGFGWDVVSVAKLPAGYAVITTVAMGGTGVTDPLVLNHIALLEQITIGAAGSGGAPAPGGTCDRFELGVAICGGDGFTTTGASYVGRTATYAQDDLRAIVTVFDLEGDSLTLPELRDYMVVTFMPEMMGRPAPLEPLAEAEVVMGNDRPALTMLYPDEGTLTAQTIAVFPGGAILLTTLEAGTTDLTDAHAVFLVALLEGIALP